MILIPCGPWAKGALSSRGQPCFPWGTRTSGRPTQTQPLALFLPPAPVRFTGQGVTAGSSAEMLRLGFGVRREETLKLRLSLGVLVPGIPVPRLPADLAVPSCASKRLVFCLLSAFSSCFQQNGLV